MIPKKIHFVWFSEKISDDAERCIQSWKKYLSEYELVHWNRNNFDISQNQWVSQALENKKWAFATDYVRLWTVYHYGGIYFDTDVEVLKSFDDLLHLPYFLGREKDANGIEAATFGSEPHSAWVKECLNYYENRDFVIKKNKFSIKPLPQIMNAVLKENFGLKEISDIQSFDFKTSKIQLLPVDYFSPKHWETQELQTTENTYSIHHFVGSWKSHSLFSQIGYGCLKKIKMIAKKILGKHYYFIKKVFKNE